MKPTKKEIQKVLRTTNTTAIFRIAKMKGVDVSKKINVMKFIEEYAPSKKIRDNSYFIALHQNIKHFGIDRRNQVLKVIEHAKKQLKEPKTPYTKILIEGNKNIYWASEIYQHSDYNKSIAMTNTQKNRELMKVINKLLFKI